MAVERVESLTYTAPPSAYSFSGATLQSVQDQRCASVSREDCVVGDVYAVGQIPPVDGHLPPRDVELREEECDAVDGRRAGFAVVGVAHTGTDEPAAV